MNDYELLINDLAEMVYANFYKSDDLQSLSDFTNYFESELMISQGESITDLDSLIEALERDIDDLIHNGNTTELLSPELVESLSKDDDQFDIEINRYNDWLMQDDFLKALATIILAQIEKDN